MKTKTNYMILTKALPLLMFVTVVYARHDLQDATRWEFSIVKLDELTYQFRADAYIPDRWKIPSIHRSGAAVATKFMFADSPVVFFRGPVYEDPAPTQLHEPRLGGKVLMHTGHVVFYRTIRRIPYLPLEVRGSVQYESSVDGEPVPVRTVNFQVAYTTPKSWKPVDTINNH